MTLNRRECIIKCFDLIEAVCQQNQESVNEQKKRCILDPTTWIIQSDTVWHGYTGAYCSNHSNTYALQLIQSTGEGRVNLIGSAAARVRK